jgi:sugar lactone lactonase YvrE
VTGLLAASSLGAALLAIRLAAAGNATDDIGGNRPAYGPGTVAAVPSAGAIVRRFWAPGLDAGYNPQGLAVSAGAVLVAAYRSNAYSMHRGPCRVFRLDKHGGGETGHFDVPAPCGHAGGLAVADDKTLYISDTHTLFGIALAQAFGNPAPPFRRLPLGPGLVGAFAASSPGNVWIGTYREHEQGRAFRFSTTTLAAMVDGEMLTVAHSVAQFAIPSDAQGGAVDRGGLLWIARSSGRWGELDRLNPGTGAVERRYAMPAGIEGIAFDADGLLWVVSEAGARHTYDNPFVPWVTPFFPLVFALDPLRLE